MLIFPEPDAAPAPETDDDDGLGPALTPADLIPEGSNNGVEEDIAALEAARAATPQGVIRPTDLPEMNDDQVNRAWEQIEKLPLRGVIQRSLFEAKEQFAELMRVRITPEIVGVNLLEAAEILADAMRIARSTALNPKTSVRAKLLAFEQITLAGRAQAELGKQILRMYPPRKKNEDIPIRTPIAVNGTIAPSGDGPLILANNVQINSPGQAKTGAG
jgi:hypothetical protein